MNSFRIHIEAAFGDEVLAAERDYILIGAAVTQTADELSMGPKRLEAALKRVLEFVQRVKESERITHKYESLGYRDTVID